MNALLNMFRRAFIHPRAKVRRAFIHPRAFGRCFGVLCDWVDCAGCVFELLGVCVGVACIFVWVEVVIGCDLIIFLCATHLRVGDIRGDGGGTGACRLITQTGGDRPYACRTHIPPVLPRVHPPHHPHPAPPPRHPPRPPPHRPSCVAMCDHVWQLAVISRYV